MKKFISILWALLLAVPAAMADDECQHFNVDCVQVDGIMKFTCRHCKQVIKLADWTQTADFGLTVNDPMLDMQADLHNIGQQLMFVSSTSTIKQIWVINEKDDKLLAYIDQTKGNPSPMAQIYVPWSAISNRVAIVAHLNVQTMTGSGSSMQMVTSDTCAVTHYDMKPFHGLRSMYVSEVVNPDSDMVPQPYNRVQFSIYEPDKEDVMDGDNFVVYRAKKPDFSDAEVVASFELNDYYQQTSDHGHRVGWYYFNDKSPVASYNEYANPDSTSIVAGIDQLINNQKFSDLDKHVLEGFYSHPSQPIYYKVSRTTTMAMWPSHTGIFALSDSVNVSRQLPSVSAVKVTPTTYWATTKKATIKVELANPMPWEYNELEDALTIKNELQGNAKAYRRYIWDNGARIRLVRFSPKEDWGESETSDPARLEHIIAGNQVKWNHDTKCWEVEVEDCQALPYTHYYYEAIVERGESTIPLSHNNTLARSSESDANLCYSKVGALIDTFTATQGKFPGRVLLQWTFGVGRVDNLLLQRRENSRNRHTEWEYLDMKGSDMKEFMDETALSGHAYEYRLVSSYNCRGTAIKDSADVQGWGSYNSSISGFLVMPNGTAMAHEKVTLRRMTPVFIDDVVDDDGKVIMYGYHDGVVTNAPPAQSSEVTPEPKDSIYAVTVMTDERGYYKFNDLPYMGEGTQYELHFERLYRNGGVQSSDYTYTLSDAKSEVSEYQYVCGDVATFSGMVTYSESTVPVMDVHFVVENRDSDGSLLSSYVLRNADGEPVKTNAMGEFSFTVPALKSMSIRAEKDGHTFSDSGYLLDEGAKKVFTPQPGSKTFIRQIYDDTRVRLVGRICGGNVEAHKELGFSMSRNNLGDQLTVQLQLEGNNTSWLVYKNDEPDNTTIQTVVNHPYVMPTAPTYKPHTDVTYEKKRIIIHPDSMTGEFFVDLIPTKYRVSELSALGYPTLYQHNEGLDILDLNACVEAQTMKSVSDTTKHFDYHASYIRPYHVPAVVSYEQMNYGRKSGYLGESEISLTTALGEAATYPLAAYDEAADSAYYTFGHPVFKKGNKYILKIYAHEDFFYNNNPMGEIDEVPLDSGIVHIQNGLLDNMNTQQLNLDKTGSAMLYFTVGSPIFNQTGDAALRSLNVSVELNDYYYEATPLSGYVLGDRALVRDSKPLLKVGSHITKLDVLCDPPGSTSYAYREAGTSYEWTHEKTTSINHDLKIAVTGGVGGKTTLGIGFGVENLTEIFDFNVSATGSANVPIVRDNENSRGYYRLTLSERIETSHDPLDVGAMADLYIGAVNVTNFDRTESMRVIDEDLYQLMKGSIESGAIRLVAQGKDANGKNHYLVTGDVIVTYDSVERTFIYSQKHILGVIIPELERQIDAKLMDGDRGYLESLAEQHKMPIYMRDASAKDGYTMLTPKTAPDMTFVDEVADLHNTIVEWRNLIGHEEEQKYKAAKKMDPSIETVKQYSVAGTTVSYSEDAAYYYNTHKWVGPKKASFGIGVSGGEKPSGGEETNPDDGGNDAGGGGGGGGAGGGDLEVIPEVGEDEEEDRPGEEGNAPSKGNKLRLCGVIFGVDFNWNRAENTSNSMTFSRTTSVGYGFVMNTNDNGYMDVDVYGVKQDIDSTEISQTGRDFIFESRGNLMSGSSYPGTEHKDKRWHNFMFYVRGGAARNPYIAPDESQVYTQGGAPVSLGEPMLKIDNPKIYIDHPIVNNQPEDEAATMRIRLTNETEINPDAQLLNPSNFRLYIDDASNPNGAEFSIDGMPLAGGKDFILAPGHTIEKTIKIARGAGYDFENLRVIFRDAACSLYDTAQVSLHYLPVATHVNITTPEDKWVMNTLSPHDENGYYIPINIDGFNVNSDGFHHLELQYKKKTDGESKWTNVCSFYNDEAYYDEATGQKEMIPSTGRISNLKFYGEKDPVEMEYDLRAVAFRAVGTGFVTRVSDVVSGRKDTRCPTVFGSPKPANGILTFSDVISIPFNEPIAYNYLDKIANFQISGRTNTSEQTYAMALYFPSMSDTIVTVTTNDVPRTKVKRNLSGNDFTFDAMVRMDDGTSENAAFFMIYNPDLYKSNTGDSGLQFGRSGKRLCLTVDKQKVFSPELKGIDFSVFHRYGVTFEHATANGDEPHVVFYVDGVSYQPDVNFNKYNIATNLGLKNSSSGQIYVGCQLQGSMTDIRLWNRALPSYEMAQKRNLRVSYRDLGLVSYWPLNEGRGTVAHDIANGADFYFSEQTWQSTSQQYSLRLDGRELALTDGLEISREQSYDYTLSLWTSVEQLDADSVTLFRTGEVQGGNYLRLGIEKDNLVLHTRNDEIGEHRHTMASVHQLADKGWHCISVVANKSQNTGALYFDGDMVQTLTANDLAGIANTSVVLGDTTFHGNFDNITLWDHAFPTNSISMLNERTASGNEMGLLLNLPFEQTLHNEQGAYTAFSALNTVRAVKESTGEVLPMQPVLSKDVMADEKLLAQLADKSNYCPLEPTTGEKDIDFTWTSTGNELQIHLKMNDTELNHQNVNVVVRAVEDNAGNPMMNPQRMTLYVDKNVLRWNDQSRHLDVPYGEGATLGVKFSNVSGKRLDYSIYESCSWMDIDHVYGQIAPLGEQEVTVTIDKGLAPGEYLTSLSLCDENDLVSVLPLAFTVTAMEPEWEVTTDPDYRQQMNVVAQVYQPDSAFLDIDTRDIVYAFYDGICLSKTYIQMVDDEPYVYMTIKGKQSMNAHYDEEYEENVPGAEISFRIWRATTGTVSYLTPSYVTATGEQRHKLVFAKNTTVGTHASPVELKENGMGLQNLSLKKGWNWVSFNVRPYQTAGVNGLFESNDPFTPGDMINTFDGNMPSVMQNDMLWSGGKDALPYDVSNVYQIWVSKDCQVQVVGTDFSDKDRQVTLKNGNGWNNLPYLYTTDKSITEVMADYLAGDKAANGTTIMGRSEFAQVENGRWYGSLRYMQPGQGYYLLHKGKAGEVIHFYDQSPLPVNKAAAAMTADGSVAAADAQDYMSSMAVVATVAEGDALAEGDMLVAYRTDASGRLVEKIGTAQPQTLHDGRQRCFIMLSAPAGAHIVWAKERQGEVMATAQSTVRYTPRSLAGTISSPLVIDFVNGSDSADKVIYYTVGGVRTDEESVGLRIGSDGTKTLH